MFRARPAKPLVATQKQKISPKMTSVKKARSDLVIVTLRDLHEGVELAREVEVDRPNETENDHPVPNPRRSTCLD